MRNRRAIFIQNNSGNPPYRIEPDHRKVVIARKHFQPCRTDPAHPTAEIRLPHIRIQPGTDGPVAGGHARQDKGTEGVRLH